MKRILILSAIPLAILFFGFGVVTGYSIPSPSASAPLHSSGSSPEDALEMICHWESMPPNRTAKKMLSDIMVAFVCPTT